MLFRRRSHTLAWLWPLLLSLFMLSPLRAAELQWGLRPYAEEAPRYQARVAALEAEGKALEEKRNQAYDRAERLTADWSAEEREEAQQQFHSSRGSKLNANRSLYEDEHRWARESYQRVLEGAAVDPRQDDMVGMSQRDSLWSAHVRYLKARNQFLYYDSLYQDQRQQFLQAYLNGSVERFFGIKVDAFIDDTLDDAGYLIAAHANKFFDELAKCATKEVAHYVKQWAIFRTQLTDITRSRVALTERWDNPPPPWHAARPNVGAVSPEPFYQGIGVKAVECLTDTTRAMVVEATVNALRKNFIDDMADAGVDPLIGEFWWSKYILQEQKPSADDPRAPRTKDMARIFQDRVDGVVAYIFSTEFKLEQAKKTMEDELELLARKRIHGEVTGPVLKELQAKYQEIQRQNLSPADLGIRKNAVRQAAAEKVRKVGGETVANDVSLRFLKALDWGAMLLQQGWSAREYTSRQMQFQQIAGPLIEEYRRIETCLIKQKMATGAHAILGIYQMGQAELDAFFAQCDATEADMQQVAGQRLLARMNALMVQAQNAAAILARVCPEGEQALQGATASLIVARAAARPLLEGLQRAPQQLEAIRNQAAALSAVGDQARARAEAAVTARRTAEGEAEKACNALEAFRKTPDSQAQDAHKQATQAAAAAARAAADTALQEAQAADQLRTRAEQEAAGHTHDLSIIQGLGGDLAEVRQQATQARRLAGEAGQAAAAADAAWSDLRKTRASAATVAAEAQDKLAGSKSNDVQGLLAAIRAKENEIAAMAASHGGCPGPLRARADALARDLQTMDLTLSALAAAETKLKEDGDPGPLGEAYQQALADVVSAADVAEMFSDAADAVAGDASTCLDLLEAIANRAAGTPGGGAPAPATDAGAASSPPSGGGSTSPSGDPGAGAPPTGGSTVPNVTGKTAEDARAAVTAAGLTPTVSDGGPAPSLDLRFHVQHQSPAADSPAAPGSPVVVTLYGDLPVPAVTGLAVERARDILSTVGLGMALAGGDPAPREELNFRVQSQSPPAGTPLGGTATISVRVYDRCPLVAVPNVLKQPAVAAKQTVAAANLAPSLSGGDPAPKQELSYTVQFQSPGPGEHVMPGSAVALRVYSAFAGSNAAYNRCSALSDVYLEAMQVDDVDRCRAVLAQAQDCYFYAEGTAYIDKLETRLEEIAIRQRCLDLLNAMQAAAQAGDVQRYRALLERGRDCGFYADLSAGLAEAERQAQIQQQRNQQMANALGQILVGMMGAAMQDNAGGTAVPPTSGPQGPPTVHHGGCNEVKKAGANNPERHFIDLGRSRGEFVFEYETYTEKDQITVSHGSQVLFSSGCVGTKGMRAVRLPFSGLSSEIVVDVRPNCAGGNNTQWVFIVHCPQ